MSGRNHSFAKAAGELNPLESSNLSVSASNSSHEEARQIGNPPLAAFLFTRRPFPFLLYKRYMHKHLKISLFAIVGVFAAIGLLFTAVFVAMQFGLLNVRGASALRNQFFTGTTTPAAVIPAKPCNDASKTVCDWSETPEWDVVAGGLEKDAALIARVSGETGIPPRLIASVVIPEQIRFFTSEWWNGYPPRDAREIAMAIGRLRHRALADGDDFRTPWEMHASPDAIVAYERAHLDRSVVNMRGMGWL